MRRYRCHSCEEGNCGEDSEGPGHAKADPEGGGYQDEEEDKRSSFENVAQRTEEEESHGIARLHDGGYLGDLFIRDAKVIGQDIEDGVVVVEICDLSFD